MEIKVRKPFCLSFKGVPTPLKLLCDNVSGSLVLSESLNKLISLVRTKVDEALLNTMIRFYDPLLHCFTYRDFQLVPTLEEFSSILGLPVLDQMPYTGEEETPKLEDVAAALHLPRSEIKKVWVNKGDYTGVPIDFLYSQADILINAMSMDALEKVLACLIYGQVLLPRYDKIVDVIALKIFISNNPVPTLLGDLLHSIHHRSSKGKGCVLGCAPILHKWFISHLPRSMIKNEEGLTWVQRIIRLSYDDIIWSQKDFEGTHLFDSCGDFPNVPLLDTTGKKKLFIRAWSKVKKVCTKELGPRNYIPSDLYFRWIYDQVIEHDMPYPSDTPIVPRVTPPVIPVVLEPYVPAPKEDLAVTIASLRREKADLESRLQKIEAEKAVLVADAKERDSMLDYFSRKWKIEDFVSPDQIQSWEREIDRLVQERNEMIKAHKEEIRILKRKRRAGD
ncbi:uncharacterized protein LOC131614696 [Vicia villosa]|uniref:uncharacterized protein LOC131614626 n=1 Tax=Vicia villosa TaxID=3911 RepID=UPI00273B9389|nr:uncharacterized protein LOC131614626 [Vicia villosa]XP_058742266.1 uncharacterized protein LOC131614696 [Vicia villosa]